MIPSNPLKLFQKGKRKAIKKCEYKKNQPKL